MKEFKIPLIISAVIVIIFGIGYLCLAYFLMGGGQLGANPIAERLDKLNAIPTTIELGEKEFSIEYTDNNDNENFIVKTDSQLYGGWGVIDVLTSVTNVSATDQNVAIVYVLNGEKRRALKVERFIRNETVAAVYVPEEINTKAGTSTPAYTIPAYKKAVWATQSTQDGLPVTSIERKDTKEYDKFQRFNDYLASGETAVYKVRLEFPRGITNPEEFFIEVFGDTDYGHLDPEYIDDNFDSYNNGDLNGQGSWTGDADFDVQTSVTQGGSAKAIIDSQSAGLKAIQKSHTAAASGSQYCYLYFTTFSGDGHGMWGYSGATLLFRLREEDGTATIKLNGTTVAGSLSTGTWYKVEYEWDAGKGANGEIRAQVDDGTWTAWQAAAASFTDMDTLLFRGVNEAGQYWDTCGQDGGAPPAVGATPNENIIFFQ